MPQSILCDRRYLEVLSLDEIDELCLGWTGRQLVRRDLFEGDNLHEYFRLKAERQMIRYRSRTGLLDFAAVDPVVFRQQFRFAKEDFEDLCYNLRVPEVVTSAQGVRVPGSEALCIALRRLAYPNRWCDLEAIFGRHSSVMSSVTSLLLTDIAGKFKHLLDDINNHSWLSAEGLERFSQAVEDKGAPLPNCWGFIDGTARPISRPKRNQKAYFSGHKRCHCLKYQAIMCPNGIVCQLDGPYPGRRHDAGILRDCGAYAKLEKLMQGKEKEYAIYGDPAYPLLPLLMKPYGGAHVTAPQQMFNMKMSQVR